MISVQVSIWHFRNQLAVSDSSGRFWAVKGGFRPSFGHRPAQNRFWTAQNRTLTEVRRKKNPQCCHNDDLYLKVTFIQKEGKFTFDHTANITSQ